MRFALAITVIVSGASASVDDVDVHVDKTLTDKINAVFAPASLSPSINSKKGQRFVLSPFQESKIEDTPTYYSYIGSRKLYNSIIDEEDYDNKGSAVTLDDSSTPDTKTFELGKKKILGVLMHYSSKEDVSIGESNLLGHSDDTSTAATVADDEGIHHLYLAPEHYSLDTVDGESLDTKEAVKDRRQLRSDNDCKSYCSEFGHRPKIRVSGSEFQSLINDCINNNCPPKYDTPLDCWKTSKVTDMRFAFRDQTSFDDPLGCWDVAKVTDMYGMFLYAYNFNQPIASWDVAEVTNMFRTFVSAEAFNQPLESWTVSKVTTMRSMFYSAYKFDRPLESWDVSNVYNMRSMFYSAREFDQPLESWDVSNVYNMRNMFYSAREFNRPLESWDVSKVTTMFDMFYDATRFNQCLATWADKTGSVDTSFMFYYTSCPIKTTPDPNMGPWCQVESEGCIAPVPTAAPTRSKKSKKSKKGY